jgi:hypothetical protein
MAYNPLTVIEARLTNIEALLIDLKYAEKIPSVQNKTESKKNQNNSGSKPVKEKSNGNK